MWAFLLIQITLHALVAVQKSDVLLTLTPCFQLFCKEKDVGSWPTARENIVSTGWVVSNNSLRMIMVIMMVMVMMTMLMVVLMLVVLIIKQDCVFTYSYMPSIWHRDWNFKKFVQVSSQFPSKSLAQRILPISFNTPQWTSISSAQHLLFLSWLMPLVLL